MSDFVETDEHVLTAEEQLQLQYEKARAALMQKATPIDLDKYEGTMPVRPESIEQDILGLLKSIGSPIGAVDRTALPIEALGWSHIVKRYADYATIQAVDIFTRPASDPSLERDMRRLEFADAMEQRSQQLIIGLAKVLNEATPANDSQLQLIRDGLRAQMVLMHIANVSTVDEAFNLPEFFFKSYRGLEAATSGGLAAHDLLLELWQKMRTDKEKGRGGIAEDIALFTEKNKETYTEGKYTAETGTEIARDEVAVQWLLEQKILPAPPGPIQILDFGPFTGERRLRPLILILKNIGYEITDDHVVGVDTSQVDNPITEMRLLNTTFIESGKKPELRGRFHMGKIDWSSRVLDPTVRGQMLAMAAMNRNQVMGGVLIEDTVFPEGQGSMDEALKDIKDKLGDVPEGFWKFKYPDSDKPVDVWLSYYDFIIKLYEDSGYKILNIPPGWKDNVSQSTEDNRRRQREEMHKYFKQVIDGDIDITAHKKDSIQSPVWKANGPRVTIIAQKVAEVESTPNTVLRDLISQEFGSVDQK